MRITPVLAALLAATALSACSKSATNKAAEGGQAAQGEQAPAPKMTEEERQKALASLPAPYNTADLANGEAKFALCQSCHTVQPGGANMTGPNLHGVFGRHTASVEGFKYSDALKGADFTWDGTHLDEWLTKPQDFLPGTKMTFPGLKDPKDRADLIAYLMVESGYRP
jgi:cytochrome c